MIFFRPDNKKKENEIKGAEPERYFSEIIINHQMNNDVIIETYLEPDTGGIEGVSICDVGYRLKDLVGTSGNLLNIGLVGQKKLMDHIVAEVKQLQKVQNIDALSFITEGGKTSIEEDDSVRSYILERITQYPRLDNFKFIDRHTRYYGIGKKIIIEDEGVSTIVIDFESGDERVKKIIKLDGVLLGALAEHLGYLYVDESQSMEYQKEIKKRQSIISRLKRYEEGRHQRAKLNERHFKRVNPNGQIFYDGQTYFFIITDDLEKIKSIKNYCIENQRKKTKDKLSSFARSEMHNIERFKNANMQAFNWFYGMETGDVPFINNYWDEISQLCEDKDVVMELEILDSNREEWGDFNVSIKMSNNGKVIKVIRAIARIVPFDKRDSTQL